MAVISDVPVKVDIQPKREGYEGPVKKLPGDLAMWFFILAELTVFAIFFFGYCWMYYANTALYVVGQATLHPMAGFINTLALITSSYLVAIAMIAAKQGRTRLCKRGLIAAIFVSFIYVATKLWEYNILFGEGYSLSTNSFYMFYFFITGFHFMHVLLGMVILAMMTSSLRDPDYVTNNLSSLESGACYWHMVDLVWIILFPLMYVI
jgi:nitric oxide reductase NorE protein